MEKLIRVLLTKPTQDCHDRGVRYLERQLRDAGFEVVNTAVQEDVDVVGVSTSSGGHMVVLYALQQSLRHAEEKYGGAQGNAYMWFVALVLLEKR